MLISNRLVNIFSGTAKNMQIYRQINACLLSNPTPICQWHSIIWNFQFRCTISPASRNSVEFVLSATVLERVADAKLSGAIYKYAPAGKMEPAPGRSGSSVELPATVNCLLTTFGGLPVIDRWHLTICNELRVTVISHPASFNAHPVIVISHLETFNVLPVVVISHAERFKTLPVTEIAHPVMFRAFPGTVNGYWGHVKSTSGSRQSISGD